MASFVLIVLGTVMLAANALIYIPKFIALRDATAEWAKNSTSNPPPNPASFGISTETYYMTAILGFGYLPIFIGAAYLVIVTIRKVAEKLGYVAPK